MVDDTTNNILNMVHVYVYGGLLTYAHNLKMVLKMRVMAGKCETYSAMMIELEGKRLRG